MSIGLALTDGLGRVWDLMAPGACPVALTGLRALDRPTIDPIKGPGSPALHGTRWYGWRASERQAVLPLGFYATQNIMATVREFTRGIVPEQPGMPGPGRCVLTVTLPDSTKWDLDLWLLDDGHPELTRDPDRAGRYIMTTTWGASVFWTGTQWSSTWQASVAPSNWLLTSGGVAALGSSHTLSTASTTNAGDVRVWPVWTIDGPCTLASVGVGTHQVTLSATLAAGQSVVIDTDPELGQTAIRNDGTDLTSSLTAVDFAPVEPGGTTALALSMTGTGSISMSYRPKRLALL